MTTFYEIIKIAECKFSEEGSIIFQFAIQFNRFFKWLNCYENFNLLPFRGKEAMKNYFKNFGKKFHSAQKKNAASSYRIPETIWMTDLKKASEWGALLQKKGHPKKVPSS